MFLYFVKNQFNSFTLENEMKPDNILGYRPTTMTVAEADTRLVRDTLFTANLRGIQVETVCVFTNKKATLALPRGTGHYTLKDFKALLGKSKYEQDKGVDIPQTVDAVKKWVVEG